MNVYFQPPSLVSVAFIPVSLPSFVSSTSTESGVFSASTPGHFFSTSYVVFSSLNVFVITLSLTSDVYPSNLVSSFTPYLYSFPSFLLYLSSPVNLYFQPLSLVSVAFVPVSLPSFVSSTSTESGVFSASTPGHFFSTSYVVFSSLNVFVITLSLTSDVYPSNLVSSFTPYSYSVPSFLYLSSPVNVYFQLPSLVSVAFIPVSFPSFVSSTSTESGVLSASTPDHFFSTSYVVFSSLNVFVIFDPMTFPSLSFSSLWADSYPDTASSFTLYSYLLPSFLYFGRFVYSWLQLFVASSVTFSPYAFPSCFSWISTDPGWLAGSDHSFVTVYLVFSFAKVFVIFVPIIFPSLSFSSLWADSYPGTASSSTLYLYLLPSFLYFGRFVNSCFQLLAEFSVTFPPYASPSCFSWTVTEAGWFSESDHAFFTT